jgi:2-hydroxy-3-oxopropionate reductase
LKKPLRSLRLCGEIFDVPSFFGEIIMTTKIGFIGPGIMGRPMALNLLKAGHALAVYGRRPQTTQPLTQAGATAYASPKEVAANADVIITMVSDTPDVEQVIFGDNGVVHGARSGSVVVDMSTISPSATRRFAAELAKRGVEMLDAPVSGGEAGAINATLSIMVGGKPQIFERVKPLFEAMGKNIVHVGDHGSGQVAKACNNLVIAVTLEGIAEAFALARKCDVDLSKVREALMGGSAYSKVLEIHAKRILDRDFKPGFKARLHQKDLNISMDEARNLGVAMPATAVATQNMNALVGSGDGDLDSSALAKIVERLNGIKS